jgi:hypothetical protein
MGHLLVRSMQLGDFYCTWLVLCLFVVGIVCKVYVHIIPGRYEVLLSKRINH